MTSSIQKNTSRDGTRGGITSAYAQTYDPLPEDPLIGETELFDGTAEQMHGASDNSQWCFKDEKFMYQHYNWVGVKNGDWADFSKALKWQGIDNFYHKGGQVTSPCTNMYFDNLWVTTDTLTALRYNDSFSTVVVENFILQVGTTNVYGQSFGNRIANKPLVLNEKSITYGSKTTSKWGVDKKGRDTQFIIKNYADGSIRDVEVNGGQCGIGPH